MGIKEFLKNKFSKDEDFKDAQKQQKIQRLLEQREKNSNERELDRFVEEDRQEHIKISLEKFRQRQKEQMRNNIFKQKNIFKGHKNILDDDGVKILKLKAGKGNNLYFK